MKKNTILEIIIILGVIGLIVSLYLLKDHYFPQETAVCGTGKKISCGPLQTGKYSVLFHVPVALLGVVWFAILPILGWKASKSNGLIIEGMLGWSALGMLSVVYFITLEVLLKTICPFCTIIHIIVVVTLILAYLLYCKKKVMATESIK